MSLLAYALTPAQRVLEDNRRFGQCKLLAPVYIVGVRSKPEGFEFDNKSGVAYAYGHKMYSRWNEEFQYEMKAGNTAIFEDIVRRPWFKPWLADLYRVQFSEAGEVVTAYINPWGALVGRAGELNRNFSRRSH